MAVYEIFTGPGCAHCEAAKALLRQHGLAYAERDVSDPEVMGELQTRLPRVRAIPQVFFNGEHLGNDEDLQHHLCRPRVDV